MHKHLERHHFAHFIKLQPPLIWCPFNARSIKSWSILVNLGLRCFFNSFPHINQSINHEKNCGKLCFYKVWQAKGWFILPINGKRHVMCPNEWKLSLHGSQDISPMVPSPNHSKGGQNNVSHNLENMSLGNKPSRCLMYFACWKHCLCKFGQNCSHPYFECIPPKHCICIMHLFDLLLCWWFLRTNFCLGKQVWCLTKHNY